MQRSKSPRIHIVSDGDRHVAFCPDTMAALAVDEGTRAGLEAYAETGDAGRAAGSAGISRSGLEELIRKLVSPPAEQRIPDLPSAPDSARARQAADEPQLDRLVLHVSNDCNLRCRYCYADGGAYGRPRGQMPRETAVAAINWAVRAHGGVRRVQFFGGEPLLNPRLMIEVCEYFRALKDAGEIRELPRFAMVTNGTLGDERVIELLRRYDMAVTISIDGPGPVHDALRGEASFEKADRFARECLDASDLMVDFECTWTPVHVDMGIRVVDLVEFFHERYGVRVLHVVPVSARPDSALHLPAELRKNAYTDAARYTVRTLAAGTPRANSLSHRVLDALQKREPRGLYCPAGVGTLAVAADGGLYPCFMFVGDNRFRICRFGPDDKIHESRADEVSAIVHACKKDVHEDCLSCWAAPLCSGCIGADFIETGDVTRRAGCDTMRAIAETILLEVAAA